VEAPHVAWRKPLVRRCDVTGTSRRCQARMSREIRQRLLTVLATSAAVNKPENFRVLSPTASCHVGAATDVGEWIPELLSQTRRDRRPQRHIATIASTQKLQSKASAQMLQAEWLRGCASNAPDVQSSPARTQRGPTRELIAELRHHRHRAPPPRPADSETGRPLASGPNRPKSLYPVRLLSKPFLAAPPLSRCASEHAIVRKSRAHRRSCPRVSRPANGDDNAHG